MTTHDAINAVFEGGGAVFLCLNVRRLVKDKSVKGVSLLTTSWWTTWGFWNVYFYSAVKTPASFYAGIAVVIVNAVWLALAVRYARPPKLRREHPLDAPCRTCGHVFGTHRAVPYGEPSPCKAGPDACFCGGFLR